MISYGVISRKKIALQFYEVSYLNIIEKKTNYKNS